MKKFTKMLLFLGSIFLLCSSAPSRWSLIASQDGIEFYVAHLPSADGKNVNTVIKAKNMNDYTVRVSFVPSIACDGVNFQDRTIESTYLTSDSDLSLYTYKICQDSQNAAVKILRVSVVVAP